MSQVNGSILYPAAGILVMAIEAMNQTAASKRDIKGFRLQNVIFHTALRISSAMEGTEAQLHMSSDSESQIGSAGWTRFTAYYHENDQWIETCRGDIQIEYSTDSSGLQDQESNAEAEYHTRLHESTARRCTMAIDSNDLYRRFEQGGNDYGPAFRRLDKIHISNNKEAKAEVRLFQWSIDDYPQSHIIHPASLDGLSQLVLVSFCGDRKEVIPARVGCDRDPQDVGLKLWSKLSSHQICSCSGKIDNEGPSPG